jgi:hypothetical protein
MARELEVALVHTAVRREHIGCREAARAIARAIALLAASVALCHVAASLVLAAAMVAGFWSHHWQWLYRRASLASSPGSYDAVSVALRLEILSRVRHTPATRARLTPQSIRYLIH